MTQDWIRLAISSSRLLPLTAHRSPGSVSQPASEGWRFPPAYACGLAVSICFMSIGPTDLASPVTTRRW
jgi:hypothetical protein